MLLTVLVFPDGGVGRWMLLVLESPVFWFFDPFFELEHCHKNSPLQLGSANTNFQGQSSLFSGLGPENFLFQCPSFIGEFLWQCASCKTNQKGKRLDFQALDAVVSGDKSAGDEGLREGGDDDDWSSI